MDTKLDLRGKDEWKAILHFLPEGWEEQAKELGAFVRTRRISSPQDLLKILLVHIAEGHSLRTTAAIARGLKIADISDVAIMKRLSASYDWLKWMCENLCKKWICPVDGIIPLPGRNVRLIDGSTIQEPGAKGATWRLHYSFNLFGMVCDEVHITGIKKGEKLSNYNASSADILIADRGYFASAGIVNIVKEKGADVIIRMKHSIYVLDRNNKKTKPLEILRHLNVGEIGDWPVSVEFQGARVNGRLCAIKKSPQSAEKEKKRILKEASKKGKQVSNDSLLAASYVMIFTTLDTSVSASYVLDLYRCRWQIELSFKRLKSILGLGCLKKYDNRSALAWMHGKILVAFLIEAIIKAGENFFPWGYPKQN